MVSCAQTCVFGRMGRSMVSPFYLKLNAKRYGNALSEKGTATVRRCTVARARMRPRKAIPKPSATDRIVYTDAAGMSHIASAATIDPARVTRRHTINSIWITRAGYRLESTVAKTNYMGVGLFPLLAPLMQDNNAVRDKSVTLYIDKNNVLQALVKNPAGPTAIDGVVAHVWSRIRDIGSSAWFASVLSKKEYLRPPIESCPNPLRGSTTQIHHMQGGFLIRWPKRRP